MSSPTPEVQVKLSMRGCWLPGPPTTRMLYGLYRDNGKEDGNYYSILGR